MTRMLIIWPPGSGFNPRLLGLLTITAPRAVNYGARGKAELRI
jgi:hypothetical protein